MKNIFKYGVVVLVLTISQILFADGLLKAYVDKNVIYPDESFVFTLEYPQETNLKPDLLVLKEKFHIISQGSSSETRIINGQKDAKTIFRLKLEPKFADKIITIPSITWGNVSSSEIKIRVSEESQKKPEEVEFSATLDKNEAYINEQIILTIRLKTSKNLQGGNIEEPKFLGAIVEQLGELEKNQEVINGIYTTTYEKRFAIFYSEDGIKNIPKISFEGQYITDNAGPSGFRGFFSDRGYKNIVARTKDLHVKIKPVPKEFPKGVLFLPAQEVIVIESLEQKDLVAQVGKAISRNFLIKGKNSLSTFLPSIKVQNIDGINIYQEAENKSDDKEKDGMTASLQFSHTYIPSKPGHFSIPAQTIYWWDIKEDKLKTAEIRSFELNVEGALQDAAPHSVVVKEEKENLPQPNLVHSENSNQWKFVSLGLFCLLLLSWVFFGFKHAKNTTNKTINEDTNEHINKIFLEIEKNSKEKNFSNLYKNLLRLKIQAKKEERKDIVDLFYNEASLDMSLRKIEEHLYKNKTFVDKDLQELVNIIKNLNKISKTAQLKSFYPH